MRLLRVADGCGWTRFNGIDDVAVVAVDVDVDFDVAVVVDLDVVDVVVDVVVVVVDPDVVVVDVDVVDVDVVICQIPNHPICIIDAWTGLCGGRNQQSLMIAAFDLF